MKVLFLLNFGFPFGMASSYRARLYAQSLKESGIEVDVVPLRYSNILPNIENLNYRGIYKGINFRYSTGTSIRPNSFIHRRFCELKSFVYTTRLILASKKTKTYDSIYYYGNLLEKNYSILYLNNLIATTKIPHAIELCEPPWTILCPGRNSNFLSPINGVKGVIAISKYLETWASQESKRLHKEILIEKIPILVDVSEFNDLDKPAEEPSILFSGSLSFSKTEEFLINVMDIVWKQIPTCKLIITGSRLSDFTSNFFRNKLENDCEKRIILKGYLNRKDMINEYFRNWILLAPLFDDIRSIARFPTKLAEYLSTSRLVITNKIGEIPVFLQDGINAYLCEPGNYEEYALRIVYALKNQKVAVEIGKNGRKLAENVFDYNNQKDKLSGFFKKLSNFKG